MRAKVQRGISRAIEYKVELMLRIFPGQDPEHFPGEIAIAFQLVFQHEPGIHRYNHGCKESNQFSVLSAMKLIPK